MEQADLTLFAQNIRNRIQDIDNQSETSAASREVVVLDQQSVGRLSRMDALQQQAMAKATDARRNTERVQLAAALSRIEDGSFGTCDDCGEKIAQARLRLNPALRLCIECARG